jgi:hypothetical protein
MIPLVLKIKELKHQDDTKSRISESNISDLGRKEINVGKKIELYINVVS